MTLCKTENFSGSFGTFRIYVFRQYTAVPVLLKAGLDVWRTNQPLKIPHEKAALQKPSPVLEHGHYDGFRKQSDSQIPGDSGIMESISQIPGGSGVALKYTEEKLNSLDKGTIIQLFLSQQEQSENIDHNLQLVLEQLADLKRHRFGRSSERHEPEEQMSFMEVDGKNVFFNESEAVAAEGPGEDPEAAPSRKRKKKQGKREEALEGLPAVVVEHSMTEEKLAALFGEGGYKQLPDEVYRRYGFTPAKAEVEEHHVKVYAGKKTDEIVKAPHPECLLRGCLVSPSLETAVMNAKYVNAVPLYRQEQEFERYGLHISRQNMANWTIQCADRYLAVLYDHLHEKMYGYHVLQADETPVLVNKDGRPAGSKSYMWVYRTGRKYANR